VSVSSVSQYKVTKVVQKVLLPLQIVLQLNLIDEADRKNLAILEDGVVQWVVES